MDAAELTRRLQTRAKDLGFALSGVCPAIAPAGLPSFHQWLEAGFHGEMKFFESRRGAYEHPRHVLDGVRSALMLALPYRTAEPRAAPPGHGRVSRYAWGDDYHNVIHGKLRQLMTDLRQWAPQGAVRGVVDTAPILERELARQAGLGWIGKNTLLLNREFGSWFFLAALLTDLELEVDTPHALDHCGTCQACLDACPTQAFAAPYVLDSRRCISYLTIELRGEVPVELRTGLQDWLFGCDVCQDVCPWNQRAPVVDAAAFQPRDAQDPCELEPLFHLDSAAFRERFHGTPLWRTKRRGLLRNAALVLGNQRHAASVPALTIGLADVEPLVRAACAWALAQIDSPPARAALAERWEIEADESVRLELSRALDVGSR